MDNKSVIRHIGSAASSTTTGLTTSNHLESGGGSASKHARCVAWSCLLRQAFPQPHWAWAVPDRPERARRDAGRPYRGRRATYPSRLSRTGKRRRTRSTATAHRDSERINEPRVRGDACTMPLATCMCESGLLACCTIVISACTVLITSSLGGLWTIGLWILLVNIRWTRPAV